MTTKIVIPPPTACPVCDSARENDGEYGFVTFECGQRIARGFGGIWNLYYGNCINTISVIETLRRELDDLRTRVGMLEN